MLIKFISTIPQSDKNVLKVFLSLDKIQLKKDMEKNTISISNVNTKIITSNGKIIFFELNKNALFYSTKKMAIKLASFNDKTICICLSNIDNQYKLLILQLVIKQIYSFNKYKSDKQGNTENILIKDNNNNKKFIQDIIHQLNITNINRDFQNEPANIIYPDTFCKYASKLLGTHKNLKITILNDKDLQKQGFNLIYQMGKGSIHKPRFMIIKYIQNPKYKTICIIGKSVCFDTGGIDLKPSSNLLYQMKSDKTGGCTTVSLIKYIKDSNMKLNVIGLLPVIENAISGNSLRPGDIVKSYGGTTVEILNTDAEGRYILADAFDYANTLKNIDYIIDLATLTGQAGYFHCDTSAAFLTFNDQLKKYIEIIGEKVGERIYALPSWPEYVELIKSNVANVQNNNSAACTKSGTFMASMFILNFVPLKLRNKWIHFDITHGYTGHLSNGNSTILIINLLKKISSLP